MLLKSLKLRNFRQYKGLQEIAFSTNKEKKLTIILGKNTSGKTTLIQAFSWLLYGKTKFETADFLLNLEVADEMMMGESESVRVQLNLIHNDIEYRIVREQEYYCDKDYEIKSKQVELRVQYKLQNGQTEFEEYPTKRLNKILPEDLSDYFFFDGERIENLGKNGRHGKKDIANAVKGILGLEVLNNAITHLSGGEKISVIGKLQNSIDTEGNEELKKKKEQNKKNKQRLKKIEEQLESYNETIDYYRDEIDRKETIIKEHEPTANLKKEMNNNEKEIKIHKQKKEDIYKKIINDFSKYGPQFFSRPLIEQVANFVEENEIDDSGIPEMHAKAIDFLIKRGKCICGEEIKEGTQRYRKLLEQKSYLPPQSIGTQLRVFLQKANNYLSNGEDYYDIFMERYGNYRTHKKEIERLLSRNEDISSEIEGKVDVGKLETEVRDYKRKLRTRIDDKDEIIAEKAVLENNIKDIEKEIEEQAAKNDKNKLILDCLDYAKEINDKLTEHYNKKEKSIKLKLQKRVNEIFSEMYHGDRKITINEKYEYNLTTPNLSDSLQSKADESKGLETVTSFAFISGIVSLAKDKIDRDFHQLNSEPYPLVMDAPFSNADEIHVKNVSKILPEVAEQVIMVIMHKDWKYAEDVLKPYLEKIYELDKKSETYTVIRGDKIV